MNGAFSGNQLVSRYGSEFVAVSFAMRDVVICTEYSVLCPLLSNTGKAALLNDYQHTLFLCDAPAICRWRVTQQRG